MNKENKINEKKSLENWGEKLKKKRCAYKI